MRLLLFPLIILLLIPLANAACEIPLREIRQNTVLCSGIYELENGINIAGDNIVLDCNNSALRGAGLGYGILLKNKKSATIKNCNISNYETGIYLENSNNNLAANNIIVQNKFGIALYNSFGNELKGNSFLQNEKNIFNYTEVQEQTPTSNFINEQFQFDNPKSVIEESIRIKKPFLSQDEILREVNVILDKYFNSTQQNLEITRSFYYNSSDETTEILIHLKPKRTLVNLTVYESIPKCVSEYVNQILLQTGNYEIVKNDPLIAWYFAKLDKDRDISYKIFSNIDDNCRKLLYAFGIANVEETKIKQTKSSYILILFIIITALAILFYRINHRK